jgi:hypothetical protein
MALGTLLAIALLILLILADEWNPLVKTIEWQYFQNELLAKRQVTIDPHLLSYNAIFICSFQRLGEEDCGHRR